MAQSVTDQSQVVSNQLEKVKNVVEYLIEYDDKFWTSIDVSSNAEPVSDREMRIPLAFATGGNFGHWNPDGGDLGKGSGSQFDKAVVSVQHLRHGVRYTKKSQWATDSARKAVINTVKTLIKDGSKAFRRNLESLCMTAGDGVLGVITSRSTLGGKDTYTLNTDGYGARLVRKFMPVSVFQSDLAASRIITPSADGVEMNSGGANAVEIDFHDGPNKQIRIRGTTTLFAAGDKLVVSGQPTANPVSIFGVPYHHSDASSGTWLGFDRSLFPEVRASRVNAGGALSLSHARLAVNKVGDRVGMDNRKKFVAWSHPCQKQAYEEMGQLAIMINKSGGGSKSLDMYFDDMQLAGVPLKTSFSWDKTRIDFVDNSAWGRAVMKPSGFYEENGQRMWEARSATGTVVAAVDFFLCISFQLFHGNPAAAAYVSNLTVPTGY